MEQLKRLRSVKELPEKVDKVLKILNREKSYWPKSKCYEGGEVMPLVEYAHTGDSQGSSARRVRCVIGF